MNLLTAIFGKKPTEQKDPVGDRTSDNYNLPEGFGKIYSAVYNDGMYPANYPDNPHLRDSIVGFTKKDMNSCGTTYEVWLSRTNHHTSAEFERYGHGYRGCEMNVSLSLFPLVPLAATSENYEKSATFEIPKGFTDRDVFKVGDVFERKYETNPLAIWECSNIDFAEKLRKIVTLVEEDKKIGVLTLV